MAPFAGVVSFPVHVEKGIDPATDVHVILGNVSSPGRSGSGNGRHGIPAGHPFHADLRLPGQRRGGHFPGSARQRPRNAVFDSPSDRIPADGAWPGHHNENGGYAFRWNGKPEEPGASRKHSCQLISSE